MIFCHSPGLGCKGLRNFINITSLQSLLFKEVVYWRLPHFIPSSLIVNMVRFEIKGSKPESSVKRLNLFKDSIASPTWGMCDLFVGFLIFIFIIPVSNYLCKLFRNSERISSTGNGRYFLVQSSKCTSGMLTWMAASLIGLFLSSPCSA